MNKHITFSDRVKIEYLVEFDQGMSASKLACILKKSRGAIYYELKSNITVVTTKAQYMKSQDNYQCAKLQKFPFCCNPCPKRNCTHRSRIYNAYDADEKASKLLSSSRSDNGKRKNMIKLLDDKISPLIINGQSIDVALNSTKIDISNSTVRRYINNDLLKARTIDLPYTVRFRVKKEYAKRGSRIDSKLLYNRTYEDYQSYIKENPDAVIVQLDSVCGKKKDKHSILTIYFKKSKFQFGFKYNNTSSAVNKIVKELWDYAASLGFKLFDVLLTDNGPEFFKLWELEKDEEGNNRFKLFYCDPYRSYQKAECERNHGLIRRIIRKGESIELFSQSEIDYAMSHVNSYKRDSLDYETPYILFSKEYTNQIQTHFNIIKIKPKDIRLKHIK